jgi:hypothetical protein
MVALYSEARMASRKKGERLGLTQCNGHKRRHDATGGKTVSRHGCVTDGPFGEVRAIDPARASAYDVTNETLR